jgi:hypothetical protein
MSDHVCPQCGAFLQETETVCPYCRKEQSQTSADIYADEIRRQQNLILWLFFIWLVWAAVALSLFFTAFRIAQAEIPEVTARDMRFNQIEIQSKTYHTLMIVLRISRTCSSIFTVYCFAVWFRYVRTLGYSRLASIGHLLLVFVPLINLIVFLVMLHKGRVLIAECRSGKPETC